MPSDFRVPERFRNLESTGYCSPDDAAREAHRRAAALIVSQIRTDRDYNFQRLKIFAAVWAVVKQWEAGV